MISWCRESVSTRMLPAGDEVRRRPRVPAAHDVAQDVDLDEDAPDGVHRRHVEKVPVRQRDRLHDRVVGPEVPDHLPRRVDRDQQPVVLDAALRAPAVEVEERPAGLHPFRPADGRPERREVVGQRVGLDDERGSAVDVAGRVGGDERHAVRAAGPQAHERDDVLRAEPAAEVAALDPGVVRDLHRQERRLVGGHFDGDAERRLGTRRLGDVQPGDGRHRPVTRRCRRAERDDREHEEDAAHGSHRLEAASHRTVRGPGQPTIRHLTAPPDVQPGLPGACHRSRTQTPSPPLRRLTTPPGAQHTCQESAPFHRADSYGTTSCARAPRMMFSRP